MTRGRPRLRTEDWQQRGFWRRVEHHNWDASKCWPVVDGFAGAIKVRDDNGKMPNCRRWLWNILRKDEPIDWWDHLEPADTCEKECINPQHMMRLTRQEAGHLYIKRAMRGKVTARDIREAKRKAAEAAYYGVDRLQEIRQEEVIEDSKEFRDSYLTLRVKMVAVGGMPSYPWEEDVLDALSAWIKEEYPKLTDAVKYVFGTETLDEKREIAFNHLLKIYPGIRDIVGSGALDRWRLESGLTKEWVEYEKNLPKDDWEND